MARCPGTANLRSAYPIPLGRPFVEDLTESHREMIMDAEEGI